MLIRLDSRGTLQGPIARALRSGFLAGKLRAGHRLPGSRALACELGVSRNVVTFALEQLVAEGGVVVYVGTFAKTRYPALRLGFLLVPERWARLFGRAKWLADRGVPSFDQQVLANFIREGHYERHLRRMSRRYAARRQRLVEALQRHLGTRTRIEGTRAGARLVVGYVDSVQSLAG